MNIRTRLRRDDGAAAVEFALIVGVLALLLFGMLEFGLAFFSLQNLRAAAREGARAGAVGATVPQVQDKVRSAAGYSDLGDAAIQVSYFDDATNTWVPGSCPAVSEQTPNTAVRVKIDLLSPAMPPELTQTFILDIPLMPSIDLRSADVEGAFRCEGVAAT